MSAHPFGVSDFQQAAANGSQTQQAFSSVSCGIPPSATQSGLPSTVTWCPACDVFPNVERTSVVQTEAVGDGTSKHHAVPRVLSCSGKRRLETT